jgi:lysophospholipase L1-like esterase
MSLSRRKFLIKSAAGAATIVSTPGILSASISKKDKKPKHNYQLIGKGNTILFQGDSITDATRKKEVERPNNPHAFGWGYAYLTATALLKTLPQNDLKIYNRGISGNKVFQLANRWQKDCLDLAPDMLSILIGVNDYWHKRNGKYDGTVEVYENDYRKLLHLTKEKLPNVKLVICEPFVVLGGKKVDESWIKPMKQYQLAARKMADEFDATWVPFQAVFDEAVKHAPATYWSGDGVHPSMAGAQLMAEAWLKAIQ